MSVISKRSISLPGRILSSLAMRTLGAVCAFGVAGAVLLGTVTPSDAHKHEKHEKKEKHEKHSKPEDKGAPKNTGPIGPLPRPPMTPTTIDVRDHRAAPVIRDHRAGS